jgi:hypothetical protein
VASNACEAVPRGVEDVEEWARFELLDVDRRHAYVQAHNTLLRKRLAKVSAATGSTYIN